MAQPIRLGSEAGILLRILPETVLRGRKDLAEARFSLAVAGAPIWGSVATVTHDTLATATPWPLVDLLYGLARIWPWLMLEEGYPVAITPLHPGTMMDEAASRWRDLAVGQAEAEEERLFDFRQRHDLSLLFRGLTLMPLWILREGHDSLIWSPSLERPHRLAHRAVMSDLDAIGAGLYRLLATSAEPRALRAKQRWDERARRTSAQYLPIVTGLEMVELRALIGDANATDQEVYDWFGSAANTVYPVEPSELLMAARMTVASVGTEQQRALLHILKSIPVVATPSLDDLSRRAPEALNLELPAYAQGYHLAQWLREHQRIALSEAVSPDVLLRTWGVHLDSIDIAAGIDAIAVWGARHGPAVLLNTNARSRASTDNGRRSTLAHEICHLLIDRPHALPVAEVLGGQVPRWAEQRANAFAAEFLLPRAQAELVCRQSPDLLEAATRLERDFRVSRELTLHQINNSQFGQTLSASERQRLERWAL